MVRLNTRVAGVNYGATSSVPPPPPYSQFESPQDLSSIPRKTAWWQTRRFVAFLTFILSAGIFSMLSIVYCKQVLKEHARHEEEERIRLNLFWDRLEVHQCKTYGTREYTAILMNLPMNWERRVQACRSTPLEIHGIARMPSSCEDRGFDDMLGRWVINQQEPECTPYWDEHRDKGCTSPGSGRKYITQHLMNVPNNSDWLEFCATTPAHFEHMDFPGAQECFSSIWGVYGQWEISDSNC